MIVSAQRAFTDKSHPVFVLLSTHWQRTLSLNAAARSTLVPAIIIRLAGFTADQTYAFIRDAYKRFNWTDNYVPNDLNKRGFPTDKLHETKYRNCAYAKNMLEMWTALRTFVKSALAVSYKSDAEVANDTQIQHWVTQMRGDANGQIKSFPDIKTIHQLIDAITMCIHIACPQHTAVNYLQDYYQSFIINKLPALCVPLPDSLDKLKKYGEPDLMKAIPWERPQQWLLASHVPHLLSSRVARDQNLPNWALSLWLVAADPQIKDAAGKLYNSLTDTTDGMPAHFIANSKAMTEGTIPYDVMMPDYTANSILI